MAIPSQRDLDMVRMREDGRTLRQVGAAFGVSPSTVQIAERKVDRYRRAVATLEADPLNIAALGEIGRLPKRVANALRYTLPAYPGDTRRTVERLDHLVTWTRRDLERTPNMGKGGLAALLFLLDDLGIKLADD